MEQLSPEVRQKFAKMSDGRLRQKLVQAGYGEVDISTFDQATLPEYHATVLSAETAYVPAKGNKMKMKMKMVVVIVKRRLSLLKVRQMCSILPVGICRFKRGD